MTKRIRMTAMALLGAIGVTFAAPTAAHASKKGSRNTALVLGAIAAYGLIKKKPAIAGLAGAGAVYSWIQSNKKDDNDDRDRRRRRNRRYYQNNGYYNGYAPAYQPAPVYQQPYYGGYRSSGYRGGGYRSRPYYAGYNSYGADRSYRGRGHAYGHSRRCR